MTTGLEDHIAKCPVCSQAANIKDACPVGQKLHEDAVISAHEDHKLQQAKLNDATGN